MRDSLTAPVQRRAFGRERINYVHSPRRANSVPYATIALGSLLPVWFQADFMPIIPPLGFILFLTWRLMRPGLMPLWIGMPLGAFDDLFSGQPFGSAILLWSLAVIAIEIVENWVPWRSFGQDWMAAGLATLLYILASIAVSGATITPNLFLASIPQIAASLLLYPFAARTVAWLDRFRLIRTRRIN